jgi:predicted nucleic acid-binding protein
VLERATKDTAACAAHSLAEMFSTLSGRPRPNRVPLQAALDLVEQVRDRVTIATLTESEYMETFRESVKAGRMGGIVFDSLLIACARKINPDLIYTYDLWHFRMIAPDLAARIVEP